MRVGGGLFRGVLSGGLCKIILYILKTINQIAFDKCEGSSYNTVIF